MLERTYYISEKIKIKKRIDYKTIVIKDNFEPEILDTTSSQILAKFSSGNKLINIINEVDCTQDQKDLITQKVSLLIDRGYLVTKENLSKYDFKPNWTLEEIFFEVTKRCNLKCNHCYIPKDIQKDELSYDDWKSLVDVCSDLGISLIKLTGGEAMLVEYFSDLVTYIRSKGIRVRVYTNGSFLTVNKMIFLKEVGVTQIQISLDGATEVTHDKFRGTTGSYNKILKALPYLEEIALPVILSFTVSDFNENEIEQFIDLAKKYNNVKIVVSPYINYHQTFTNKDMLNVSPEIIDKLKICYEKNKSIWSDKTKYYYTFTNKYIGYCGFGLYSAYIDSVGKVLLCPLMNEDEHVIGNIKKQSLKQIWESSQVLQNFRQYTLAEIEECNTCPNINACRSGCRARAYYLNGSVIKKDPIGCMMFKE